MIKSLFELFTATDVDNYSIEEISNLISNNLEKFVKPYQEYHLSKFKEMNYDKRLNKLVIIRLVADEIWDEICKDYIESLEYKIRISAIGKIYIRSLIALDENISMIKQGYGISALSNIRLLIECIAFSKYLWFEGEVEADRYQDYATIQYSHFTNSVDTTSILSKYENGFEKDFGWMTKREYKSIPKLLAFLKLEDYQEIYKLTSHFIHASAYSVEKILQQNHKNRGSSYFPIGYERTMDLNIQLLKDLSEFIIDCFMEEKKELYSIILNSLFKSL